MKFYSDKNSKSLRSLTAQPKKQDEEIKVIILGQRDYVIRIRTVLEYLGNEENNKAMCDLIY